MLFRSIEKIEMELEQINRNQASAKWKRIRDEIVEEKPVSRGFVKFNKDVAQKLKNTFKNIQGAKYPEVDSVGDELDLDSYIDYRINKVGNFYKSSRDIVGFDIVIAIDESGSMSEELSRVKRMCSTLYEAISSIPNVRLTIVGWAGIQEKCVVKKITKSSQINSLGASGITPMGSAVWYCKHLIKSQSSPKRLFILITDGEPNTDNDIDVAKEGVRELRRSGAICSGICVGRCTTKQITTMKKIFAGEVAQCDNFVEVDEFLRKNISEQIIHSLKSARQT